MARQSGNKAQSVPAVAKLQPQAALPKVKCLKRAGSGLYGVVWEGEQGGRKVAVKVIHDDMLQVGNAMDHFRKLARVDSHPNVVTVYSVESVELPDSRVASEAVIMEWLEGETLGDRLKGPRFSIEEAKSICSSVLSGLQYIHDRGIAHGDLHPGNVILTAEVVKIIDIDCSQPNSIAKLSLNSQELAVQGDVECARLLSWAVVRHSSLDLSETILVQNDLQAADSLAKIRGIVDLVGKESRDGTTGAAHAAVDKVTAISGLDESDLSIHVAKCIDNSRFVSLRQSVMIEAADVANRLIQPDLSPSAEVTREEFQLRVVKYEQITANLAAALGTGAFFGTAATAPLWVDVLELLGNCFEARGPKGGTNVWLDLELYPAMIAFYATGIGAMAGKRYSTVFELLRTPQYNDLNRTTRLSSELGHQLASQRGWWNEYLGDRKYYTPVSMRLESTLRTPLKQLIPLDSRYIDWFDRFECFCALDEFHSGLYGERQWGPIGNYVWRHRREGKEMLSVLLKEAAAAGNNWPPLKAGFFEGSVEEVQKTAESFAEFLGKVRSQHGIF